MPTRITLRAHAADGSDFSKLRLLIDGAIVEQAVVDSPTTQVLSFDVDGLDDGESHEIGIQHYHDTSARALFIESLSIGDTLIAGDEGRQDVGALDGNVIKYGSSAEEIRFNGTWLYDAPAGLFAGGGGGGEPAENRAPSAVDDEAQAVAGTPSSIDVLANDEDLDGDTLTISAAGAAQHGTVAVQDGEIVYTADAGYVGSDSFTYDVADGQGGSDQATVSVQVDAAPSPPPPPPPPPVSGDGETVIAVQAHIPPGADLSKLRLMVDGAVVGEARITSSGGETVSFTVAGLSAAAHEIAIQHYHDTSARALSIDGVSVNGVALDLGDAFQDVGPRDGKTIWTGEKAATITYNGTFIVAAPAELFDGAPPSPPPPPPPPPPGDGPTAEGYAAAVLAEGPVAYWRFSGDAVDQIGGVSGRLENGARVSASGIPAGDAAHDQGLQLDGVNDHMRVAEPGGNFDLMIFGDSISVTDSSRVDTPFTIPVTLDAALDGAGYDVDIIDYSKSGEKTGGGLIRLRAYFDDPGNKVPDAVIVELGTNDSRQAVSLTQVENNLDKILDLFDAHDVEVLLAGTRATWVENGTGYSGSDIAAFHDIYARVAAEHGAILYEDFLSAPYVDPERYTFDYVHPTGAGNALIVDDILDEVETLIGRAGGAPGAGPSWSLSDGTIAFWLEADDLAGRQGLVSKDVLGKGAGGHLSIYLDGDALAVRLQDTTSSHELTSAPGSVSADTAHHVAFSFGGDGMQLFLDGALVDADGFTGGLDGNQEALVVGALNWLSHAGTTDGISDHLDGTIDELAIFDHQLDAADIARLLAPAEVVEL